VSIYNSTAPDLLVLPLPTAASAGGLVTLSRFDCAKFSEQCESCDATSVHLNRWLKKGSFAHAQHKVRGRKKEVTYGRCRVQATHVARKCTPCQATCWQFEVPVSRRSLESDNHLSLSFLQSCPASLLLSSLVHSALVVSPPPAPFNIPKTSKQSVVIVSLFVPYWSIFVYQEQSQLCSLF
jgi:hypothetical protein